MFDITSIISEKDVSGTPITIKAVEASHYEVWLNKAPQRFKNWVTENEFKGSANTFIPLPNGSGKIDRILGIYKIGEERSLFATLAEKLPACRSYCIHSPQSPKFQTEAMLGWALGAYKFDRYKSGSKSPAPTLITPEKADTAMATAFARAAYIVRDLVNIPANDLGTSELADYAKKIAKECKAQFTEIVGDDLLKENYPTIHTVGRASINQPRLVDISWGKSSDPKITIVGKGVIFDSGGLDIKPSSGMILMKKDMGGAAHALALLSLVAQAKLPINLRVLLPIVENSISANAYRPSDVITTRSGKTVEVGNTDAEGRLIMADAITEAVSENPEYVIDFATLTGAARVAVGHELAGLFSNDDKMLEAIFKASKQTKDRLWPLPLHKPYAQMISSKVADIDNSGSSGLGGATTAALFLESFLGDTPPKWAHIDSPGWNKAHAAGHPAASGDAFGVWAVFEFLKNL